MKHLPEIAVAPMDVTGIPTNPMHERIAKVATDAGDLDLLEKLRQAHAEAEQKASDARETGADALSDLQETARAALHAYNEAIWSLAKKYPAAEPKKSRDEIDITPPRLGTVPIIMANSYNLGLRALLAGARYGTTGTVMQEREIGEMNHKLGIYSKVLRRADPLYREFCALTPDATVGDYWHYIQRYEEDIAVVVQGDRDHFSRDGKFLGIVGPDEIRKAKGRSNVLIRQIYKRADKVTTAKPGIDAMGVVRLLDETGESFLPIVDGERVVGVTSKASCGYHLRFPPHVDKERGGLAYLVGLRHDWKNIDLIREWIGKKMVGKGFKIDRAHLDRGTDPFRFITAIRKLVDELDPTLEVHAGNVATGDGALRAADAGATGVWVGIGPSPVCLTRVKTNYGVPQVTATEDVRTRFDNHGFGKVLLCTDGGVMDTPSHMVTVFRAGATHVVGSTEFSKTRESSPEIEHFKSKDRSKWRIWVAGNASGGVQFDAKPRDGESASEIYRRTQGPRIEGDVRHVSMNPDQVNIREVLVNSTDGDTSGISFAGGDNTAELQEFGMATRQTSAGAQEGQSRLDGARPEY
jgi:IMP dehydrogenase